MELSWYRKPLATAWSAAEKKTPEINPELEETYTGHLVKIQNV